MASTDLRQRYALEIRGLSKSFRIPVLDDLSLGVRPGELLCLLGPNGCGKTTLLRILAGLEGPDFGTVLVDGKAVDLTSGAPSVGIVFQEPRLLPWKTAAENVAVCLRPLGLSGEVAARRAAEYLDLVGLHGFHGYYSARLSGGMQQRASIARALAVEPAILLMDEPFSALDPETRRDQQQSVVEIWRATGKTIVFITHSIEEALAIGTRVGLLSPEPVVQEALGRTTPISGLSDQALDTILQQIRFNREHGTILKSDVWVQDAATPRREMFVQVG